MLAKRVPLEGFEIEGHRLVPVEVRHSDTDESTVLHVPELGSVVPSDLIAVQGVGGLGHPAIQFASKFGHRVAAVGRGPENASLAKRLGAHVYIDSSATDAAAELQKLGGARVILATAPSARAMSPLIGGLGPNGTLLVIGASAEPLEVPRTC